MLDLYGSYTSGAADTTHETGAIALRGRIRVCWTELVAVQYKYRSITLRGINTWPANVRSTRTHHVEAPPVCV